jgi:hypothetical protein
MKYAFLLHIQKVWSLEAEMEKLLIVNGVNL